MTLTSRSGRRGVSCAHTDDRVPVRTPAGESTDHLGTRSSSTYQLEALSAAVRNGAPVSTGPDDAVATMRLIYRCYELAGLPPRPRLAVPTASRRLP